MYVGIDVGTSVVKAAAFDTEGRQLAVESRPVELSLHGGFVEQDMDEVYDAVVDVLGTLTGRVPEPVELAGLTGQGDGVWLVDGEGRPVRSALSWMDGRAHELLDQWLADGTFETVFRRTGGAMFPGSPGPLLAWLDRYDPKSLDAAATAVYCKDMVFQRLTGAARATTDVSDASMPFLDPGPGRTTTGWWSCWDSRIGGGCWRPSRIRSPRVRRGARGCRPGHGSRTGRTTCRPARWARAWCRRATDSSSSARVWPRWSPRPSWT